jgi:hypothetical protein
MGESRMRRIAVTNNLSMLQSRINKLILDSASSINYEPKNFEEINIFKSLVANSLRTSNIPLTQLAGKRYVSRKTAQLFAKNKITSLGDLFNHPLDGIDIPDTHSTRMNIIDKLPGGKKG